MMKTTLKAKLVLSSWTCFEQVENISSEFTVSAPEISQSRQFKTENLLFYQVLFQELPI